MVALPASLHLKNITPVLFSFGRRPYCPWGKNQVFQYSLKKQSGNDLLRHHFELLSLRIQTVIQYFGKLLSFSLLLLTYYFFVFCVVTAKRT